MKAMLLAVAIVATPGVATAQYYGGQGYSGGGYGGGYAPPAYGYQQPRYRNVCHYERVASGYDYYGRPIYRRQQVCQQVAY